MKKLLTLFLLTFLINFSFGQVVSLKQKKSTEDIKVINGNYELFFHKTDLIKAIEYIDQKLKTNHAAIVDNLKNNKISTIDLIDYLDNKEFIDILKNNLGLYLIRQGKVCILKQGKQILKILLDEAPNRAELDGSITKTILVTEENSTKQIFLGSIKASLIEN